ncbi:MAG TPA: vanadium-dependent haloperoxidase, partial [Acidimicrobiales bacterium]|nr:vanadium-dependent haloperoxidase [Acidimicrobiales bacterium]
TVHPTRSFAIMDAAIEDAVVSTTHEGQPYLFTVTSPRSARPDAAAAQAAHDTLVALYPSAKPQVDQLLNSELGAIPGGPGKDEGARVGHTVAEILLALRANDGSAVSPSPFVAGTQPGNYRPTSSAAPQFTNWGSVTPFVLTTPNQFRPGPPPALNSQAYANAINEVQSLGQDVSTTRSADQTQAAKFWNPPIWNTWNEITSTLVTQQRTDLKRTAQVFSDLNLTFADTAIAFYDAKYTYQLWRPVTAIRLADTDGNPATVANPSWNPLVPTAADPSYPGAHSAISEAAATVLSAFFEPDTHLTVSSDALAGVTRSFNGFQAAADEAGLSRIFAGVHTRLDHVAGQELGKDVARFVLSQLDTEDLGQ